MPQVKNTALTTKFITNTEIMIATSKIMHHKENRIITVKVMVIVMLLVIFIIIDRSPHTKSPYARLCLPPTGHHVSCSHHGGNSQPTRILSQTNSVSRNPSTTLYYVYYFYRL